MDDKIFDKANFRLLSERNHFRRSMTIKDKMIPQFKRSDSQICRKDFKKILKISRRNSSSKLLLKDQVQKQSIIDQERKGHRLSIMQNFIIRNNVKIEGQQGSIKSNTPLLRDESSQSLNSGSVKSKMSSIEERKETEPVFHGNQESK